MGTARHLAVAARTRRGLLWGRPGFAGTGPALAIATVEQASRYVLGAMANPRLDRWGRRSTAQFANDVRIRAILSMGHFKRQMARAPSPGSYKSDTRAENAEAEAFPTA